ncbi:hypothetical protein ACFWFU_23890 [Streptomyces sp. NPDC060235]|uniref:hypothetical protein n=1 Tax=Streptomyces sp. NPDC060235 TaxID=3347080 RepID=UPI00364F5334
MTTFNDAVFSRGYETPDDVTVTRPVAETDGLQPEDLGVLVHLLLLPSDTSAAAKDLAAGMRALGWKMSVDRFEVIAKRLTKAGHLLRKSVYNPETKRPQWRYWAYRNPAKNPGYSRLTMETFPQVRTEIGENPVPQEEAASETGENPVSPGQSRNRVFPDCAPEPGKTRFPSHDVFAGQSRNRGKTGSLVSPPTPPLQEEEDYSSSLNPSTAVGGVAGLDEAAVTAAREFLALLPGRWACGRKTAGGLAPLLAEAAAAQGWALGPALVAQLTRRRARGKSVETGVMLAERIEDLPLYRATRAPVPGEQRETVRGPGAVQLPLVGSAPGPATAADGPEAGGTPQQPAPVAVPAELVAQARELLLSLTAPWAIGPEDAERLAPLLAGIVAERGWSFDEELRQQLMSNPGGGSNYLWLLEHKRIEALPVRRKAAKVRRVAPGRCARHSWSREGDCAPCMKAAQDAARAAAGQGPGVKPDAAEAATVQDGTPDVSSGADVDAYVQVLMSGMSAAAVLGLDEPTAEERRRIAAQTEEERRHEAHNHALRSPS